MSGHSFGAGTDSSRQPRPELRFNLQTNINKGSAVNVRPIAPTPGSGISQMTGHQLSTTHLLSGSVQTNLASKIAAMGQLTGSGDHTAQISAVNLSNTVVGGASQQQLTGSSNIAVTGGVGGMLNTQIRAVGAQQQLLQLHPDQQVTSNTLAQQNVVRLQNPMQVASLMKGGIPPQAHQQAGSLSAHQMSQVFPVAAHLPRGAAAASQLTATKPTGVAMLRPTQPGNTGNIGAAMPLSQSSSGLGVVTTLQQRSGTAVQMTLPATSGGSMSSGSGGVPQPAHIQPKPVLPMKTHGPQTTKGDSSVTAIHMIHGHSDSHKSVTSAMPPIQISVQQRNKVEVHPRPLVQNKAVTVAQPVPHSTQQQTAQKVLMSSQAPLQQSSNMHNIPANQKIGQLMSPVIRQSKVISQPANIANLTGPNTTYTLSGARTSKIIVTQSGGVSAAPNLPAGIITTMAKSSVTSGHMLPRQQKILSPQVNTMPTTINVTSVTSKGLKIAQHRLPPPAHSMTHYATPTTTGHTTLSQLEQVQAFRAGGVPSNTHPALGQPPSTTQQAVNSITGHANMLLAQQQQQKAAGTLVGVGGSNLVLPPGGGTGGIPSSVLHSGAITGSSSNTTMEGSLRESSQERVLQHSSLPFNIPATLYPPNQLAEIYQKALMQQGVNRKVTGQLQQQNLSTALQGAGVNMPQGVISNQSPQTQLAPNPNNASVRINSTSNNPAVMVNVDPSTRHITTVHQNQQSGPSRQLSMSELIAASKAIPQTGVPHNYKYVNKADNGNLVAATMASAQLNAAAMANMSSSSGGGGNIATGTMVSPQLLPAANQGGVSGVMTTQMNANSNLTASPRPSILRKRNNEGDLPSNENSQSSTDTASSTHSTPQQQAATSKPVHIKQLTDAQNNASTIGGVEQNNLENGHMTNMIQNNNNEASPRKKPRKQLLHANTEQEISDTVDLEDVIEKFSKKVKSSRVLEQQEQEKQEQVEKEVVSEYVDDEGVRWIKEKKRPPIALLHHYQCSWKVKNNHFLRHSDVKPKDERQPTVNELSNLKHIKQRSSGWKMYHLAAQLEEMIDAESVVLNKMIDVQDQVAPKHIAKTTMEDDIGMVHELSQGNIQRCQLFSDQMLEAKTAMLKILDHKKRITEIVNKNRSKRPVKKKERS